MFTSQATIERRAAKEARLHGIEERLETLEAAAALVASAAMSHSSEDVSGMKAEHLTTHEEFLAAYSKRMDDLEAAVKSDAISKRLDSLEATTTKSDDVVKRLDGFEGSIVRSDYVEQLIKRLDELEAANNKAAKVRQDRLDELAESVRKIQISLEEIRQESEEALKSLEKKLTVKPMFQPKSTSTSTSTFSNTKTTTA